MNMANLEQMSTEGTTNKRVTRQNVKKFIVYSLPGCVKAAGPAEVCDFVELLRLVIIGCRFSANTSKYYQIQIVVRE